MCCFNTSAIDLLVTSLIEVKALAAADIAKWSNVPLGETNPANPEQ